MAGRHWLLEIFQVINCILVLKGTKIISSEDIFSSMAFVFDTTGSMYDDYNQLRSHAEDIMNYVLKRNDSNIRHFVFVPFNDPVVGPVSESFVPSVIMHKINNIVVSGGGDCPEKGVTGVIEALKVVRPNSYIYVFTDASVKDFDKVPEALDLIQRKQVQVIVLKTGDNCLSEDSSYHSIASMGSGNVFDVQKNDVSKVLDFVKISMDTNRVNMLSVDIPISQLIPSPHKLNIDDSVKNLVVSVSGQTPNLEVINPVGKKLDESDGLMIDLDLPNVKIVTVIEPMPGEWTIFVASKSAHAIRVCGTSTKNFDYGFAITRPGSITHTSHRPLKGTNNYILVKYEDVQKYLSCEIKDLRSDGKFATLPIFNISKNMLLCGPFMPGNNPFYVQVFGKNNNGNFFKRITKTSITSDDPEKPYITTPKRVLVVAGEELRIICRIESLVPFNVAWNVLNKPSQFWKFNQSSEIELLVSNVTLNHSGTYDCNANNIAGSSNSSTIVEVVERPMIDGSSNDESIVIFEGEDFSTDCKGHGIPEPLVEWILKGTYIPAHSDHIFVINGTNRLVIYDATFNESNDYTCRVSNEYGISEKHFRVTVRAKLPQVAIETLEMDEFSDGFLHCPLSNNNIHWFRDNVDIESIINERSDEPHYKQTDRGLKIYELSILDTGKYTCTNSNQDSYSLNLVVAFAPHFIVEKPEEILVKKNEMVLLDCMVKGYPNPKIFWTRDGMVYPITIWTLKNVEFLNEKQQILIKEVNLSHEGIYKCVAINRLGIEHQKFSLKVY